MKKIKVEWKEKTGTYQTGYAAHVGSIRVGATHWGSSRDAGGPWVATCILPGVSIKQELTRQQTEADARKIVELAIQAWFTKALG